ncbi:MAG: ABC transporter permease [Oscillospiraceae bacterium]|jgi:ribose/xylose/arabinose/galactoside ABC-type transport system permease subunit|nr:ABC transporter permease [Oscillospiraceae bacterium]
MENTENKSFWQKYLKPLVSHKVFTLILLLLGLWIIFSIWANIVGNTFFSLPTMRNILASIVLSSFLTIGAGCLLISGALDLSQAAVGAFGGMVMASAIAGWGLPWYLAILVALALCAVFGAINALLVDKFRFPAFIATLSMSYMAKGLMYLFSSLGSATGTAQNIQFMKPPVIQLLGTGNLSKSIPVLKDIPVGVVVMLIFFIIYGVIMSKTTFGKKVVLMGGNRYAAHLAGINSSAITYILFINSAVLGGVSGIFNSAKLGQGQLLALQTNQFTGITAAILGGISFGGGAGGMGGAFIGLLILNTFQIGMSTVKVNPFWINVFTGILLLVALSFDFFARLRAGQKTARQAREAK